jgi:nucleoside-diphosphate-sugar epimerase
MRGADGVFHLAAWYKVGASDASQALRINVEGTRNVLETMGELGIPRGVYTSTVAVFSDTRGQLVDETYRFAGTHVSEYDRTKWLAHYEVAQPLVERGLPLIIVQPGVVYGPGDTSGVRTMLVDFLNGKLPVLPSRTAVCWAHVEDTARGHLLAMDRGQTGGCYILAGPPHTFLDAFTMAARVAGVRPPLAVPPGVLAALAPVAGLVERLAPLPPAFSSETLRVMAGTTYFGSNARARHELGYQVRSLEEGWTATVRHEMGLMGRAPGGDLMGRAPGGPR